MKRYILLNTSAIHSGGVLFKSYELLQVPLDSHGILYGYGDVFFTHQPLSQRAQSCTCRGHISAALFSDTSNHNLYRSTPNYQESGFFL